jgi:hypothetical protein
MTLSSTIEQMLMALLDPFEIKIMCIQTTHNTMSRTEAQCIMQSSP